MSETDFELEKMLLAMFFVLPNEDCQQLSLEIDMSDFECRENQRFFAVACAIINEGGNVDPCVVETKARAEGIELPIEHIELIYSAVPTLNINNLSIYLDYLKRYSVLRRINLAAQQMQNLSAEMDFAKIIEDADRLLTSAIDQDKSKITQKVGNDTFKERVFQQIDNPVEILGIQTGINFFDISFDGIVPGLLTLVGGRPGTGKSALNQNILYQVSVLRQTPILLVDTETSSKFVEDRLLAIASGLGYNDITHGRISKDILEPYIDAIQAAPIYYTYMPDINAKELKLICRKYKKAYGIEAVIIDFLGGSDAEKAHIEIGKKVKAMHDIGTTLDLGFVVFQQLNREQLDKNSGKNVKEVELGHFAMSDMSTWYPDGVAGIRHPTTVEKAKFMCNRMIDIPKNRFGDPGVSWPMNFTGDSLRFESVEVF